MMRTGRVRRAAATIGAATMILAAATTLATEPDPPHAGGPAVPTERNCWDPTHWGRPPLPKCREPDDVGRIPSPPTAPPPRANDAPVFVSHDLSSNRGHALRPGTLQVVTFYDGATTSRPVLRIEYAHPKSGSGWIDVTGVRTSTSDRGRIDTFEYDLGSARLTGGFEISGVVPNGVVDGLAFGLFWRDDRGFHVLRSTAPDPRPYATLVGAWPIGLNDRSFERRTPQLGSGQARQQARMTVYGAEYLDNGAYFITIQERATRIKRRAGAE